MTLHHTKHHQAYVNNLNAAEGKDKSATSPQEKIAVQAAIKFNGGGPSAASCLLCSRVIDGLGIGHVNHSLFWLNLSPASQKGGKLADGKLKELIIRDFGSVESFKQEFNDATAAIQGSGWGWLVRPNNPVSRSQASPSNALCWT